MNFTDFSKTGGFPLDTDVLDFNQKALAESLKWPAVNNNRTEEPIVALSGCWHQSFQTGFDGFSDGWMLLDGEVLPFRDGATNYIGVDGTIYLVEIRQQAVFQNGSTYNVLEVTRYLTLAPGVGVSTGYNISNVPRLESLLGKRASEGDAWVDVPLVWAPYQVAGTMFLRRNVLTRQVFVRGEIVVGNAQGLYAPAKRYVLGSIPQKFAPTEPHYFTAAIIFSDNAQQEDPALRTTYAKLNLAGNNPGAPVTDVSFALVKPTTTLASYTLRFTTSYLLD